jgi:hypothetical protein
LAALASLVFAAPAPDQQDGVFIDPDSPSAKEYAIPLESERRQADPGREPEAGIVQGERSSPIFGAGIERDRQAEGGTSSSDTRGSSEGDVGNDRRNGARSGEPEDDESDVLQAATSNPGPPDGGIGVLLTIGGVAIGVLLLGGLGGVLLRRRS